MADFFQEMELGMLESFREKLGDGGMHELDDKNSNLFFDLNVRDLRGHFVYYARQVGRSEIDTEKTSAIQIAQSISNKFPFFVLCRDSISPTGGMNIAARQNLMTDIVSDKVLTTTEYSDADVNLHSHTIDSFLEGEVDVWRTSKEEAHSHVVAKWNHNKIGIVCNPGDVLKVGAGFVVYNGGVNEDGKIPALPTKLSDADAEEYYTKIPPYANTDEPYAPNSIVWQELDPQDQNAGIGVYTPNGDEELTGIPPNAWAKIPYNEDANYWSNRRTYLAGDEVNYNDKTYKANFDLGRGVEPGRIYWRNILGEYHTLYAKGHTHEFKRVNVYQASWCEVRYILILYHNTMSGINQFMTKWFTNVQQLFGEFDYTINLDGVDERFSATLSHDSFDNTRRARSDRESGGTLYIQQMKFTARTLVFNKTPVRQQKVILHPRLNYV